MLVIARPERQIVEKSCGCDQRVSQFQMMALGILPQIFTRLNSNLCVNWDAMDRSEERLKSAMFLRSGSMPKLRDSYRRAQQRSFSPTQLVPSKKEGGIPGAGDLNQDIRVDQDGLQEASLRNRFPLRRRRT